MNYSFVTSCTCTIQIIQQNDYREDPKDREFSETWVSDVSKKKVVLGYAVVAIYKISQCNLTQYDLVPRKGEIFAGYIDTFITQKIQASGHPTDYVT